MTATNDRTAPCALFARALVALLGAFCLLMSALASPQRAAAYGFYGKTIVPAAVPSLATPSDVAVALDGTLFLADSANGRVAVYSGSQFAFDFEGSDAPAQELVKPTSVVLGPDALVYVADAGAGRVSVFTRTGAFVRSFGSAGALPGALGAPVDLAFDSLGRIHVVEELNCRVSVFSSSGAFLYAYGFPGEGAGSFSAPSAISIRGTEVFVADAGNKRIQVLSTSGAFLRDWGLYRDAKYDRTISRYGRPSGIEATADGRVYISDRSYVGIDGWDAATWPHVVEVCDASGNRIAFTGTKGSGASQLLDPSGLTIVSGTAYVADGGNDRISKIRTSDWAFTGTIKPGGSTSQGEFSSPTSAVETPFGIYVVDAGNRRIEKFSAGGVLESVFATAGPAALLSPSGIASSSDGAELYVTDAGAGNIKVFSAAGEWQRTIGSAGTGAGRFSGPTGIFVEADGNLLVADTGNNRVQRVSPTGIPLASWGGAGAADGQMSTPRAVTVDLSQSQPNGTGFIHVADSGNNRIQVFDMDGVFQYKYGGFGSEVGKLADPRGICTDPITGDILVADTANGRVQRFYSDGGANGVVAERGTAPAEVRGPEGISAGPEWTFLIADTLNHRIQKVGIDGAPPMTSISGVPDGWGPASVTLSLTAEESESGLDASYYSIDMGTPKLYQGPFAVSGSGEHSVRYWSVDKAANTEGDAEVIFRLDGTPPSTSVSGVPSTWTSGTVDLLLTSVDDESGVAETRYRVAGGDVLLTDGSATVAGEGSLLFEYGATDAVGNSETTKTATIRIDNTPPVTTATGVPAQWVQGPVNVTLSRNDNLSGVAATYYRLDGTAWRAYSIPFAVSKEGETFVEYFSVDGAGNVASIASRTVYIDRTPPSGTVTFAGGRSVVASTTIGVEASVVDALTMRFDTGSGWSAPTQYLSSALLTLPGEGARTVRVGMIDRAGNERVFSAVITVDLTAPTAAISGLPASGLAGGDVTFSMTGSDTGSGVAERWYSLDGADPARFTGPVTVIAGGPHEITYWAEDVSGNLSAPATVYFTIDRTPPTGGFTLAGGRRFVNTTRVPVSLDTSHAAHMSFVVGGIATPWAPVAETTWLDLPGEGLWRVTMRLRSAAGVVSASDRSILVDVSPPSVTFPRLVPSRLTVSAGGPRYDIVATWEAAETEARPSGVDLHEADFGGQRFLAETPAVTVRGLRPSIVPYSVRSRDRAGNWSLPARGGLYLGAGPVPVSARGAQAGVPLRVTAAMPRRTGAVRLLCFREIRGSWRLERTYPVSVREGKSEVLLAAAPRLAAGRYRLAYLMTSGSLTSVSLPSAVVSVR